MLTIGNPIKAGCEGYYIERAQEKYYTESAEERGEWFGRGAKALGLEGAVSTESFQNLLRGFSPDGRLPLVQNAGQPDRCMGWDLTLSAPKSVSVLWALAPEDVRAEILRAHQRAVTQTLAQVENTLAVSRSGKAGAVHERAGLAVVVQQHYTSRTNDVQIHSHAVVINVGVRADGSTGALHSINWFRAKKALGADYQACLARELRHALGLAIEMKKNSFHINGVPEEICDVFSKRRQKIKQVLNERGESGALAARKVALETRPKKDNVPLDRLFAKWREEADAHGWGVEHAAKLIQAAREHKLANEPAREQSVKHDSAPPLNRSSEQKNAPAPVIDRSHQTEESQRPRPKEAANVLQSAPQQPAAEKQAGQPEKSNAASVRPIEVRASSDNQAVTEAHTDTTQPLADKQKKAKAQRKHAAEVVQDANQSSTKTSPSSEREQKQSPSTRIEWTDAPGQASGGSRPGPFRYLFEGLAAKAEKSVQQGNRDYNSPDMWKLTLPAPASVNVLWALSSEATRKTIEKAHQAAAEYALSRVESNMQVVRRSDHGETVEQRKLVRSALEHQTQRGQDPNLRTKTVLQVERLPHNETPTSEQRIDSLAGAVTARLLYQVQLAAELRQRLGITVEPRQKDFQIIGLPQDVCTQFPKRCQEIASYAYQRHAQGILLSDGLQKKATSQNENAEKPAWLNRLTPDNLLEIVRDPSRDKRLSALWRAVAESFDWNATRTQSLGESQRSQLHSTRAFEKAFDAVKQRIFPERQSGWSLSWLATNLATQYGAGPEHLLRTLQKLRPAAERSFIRVEWRPLFPKAPSWSPLKNLKAPVIAIGNRPRRWGKILSRKDAGLVELRVQERRLFPRAPKWSPLHDLKFPALRFKHKSAHSPQPQKLKQHEQQHGH